MTIFTAVGNYHHCYHHYYWGSCCNDCRHEYFSIYCILHLSLGVFSTVAIVDLCSRLSCQVISFGIKLDPDRWMMFGGPLGWSHLFDCCCYGAKTATIDYLFAIFDFGTSSNVVVADALSFILPSLECFDVVSNAESDWASRFPMLLIVTNTFGHTCFWWIPWRALNSYSAAWY